VAKHGTGFPERYRFQLTKDEYENLRCQIGTSSLGDDNNSRYLESPVIIFGVAVGYTGVLLI
jgi:hypothetical protein